MWALPEVVRFVGGKPNSGSEVWRKMLTHIGHWALLDYGYWAVEEKQSGRFVGDLGFADFKRDLVPGLNHVPEIGWVLAPEFHGKGYATEAAQAALQWADCVKNWPQTACLIAPDHTVSLQVAKKLGFVESYRSVCQGLDTVVLKRLKPSA